MAEFEYADSTQPFPLVLNAPIDGLAYSWCPTMDLVAFTANNGKNVWVHRMNGYRVWDIKINEGRAKDLIWKPDGKQFAVITSKNQCHIYDSNTARLLSTVDQFKEGCNFGQWMLSEIDEGYHKFTELVDTDVLKSLPKLPPLPNATSNNTFSTKVAIEGMIHQPNKSGELDLFLLFSDKTLDITLHNLFTAGPINLISSSNDDDEEIVGHIAQDIQSHYIVTSSFSTMKLYLRQFKFSFVSELNFLQDIALSISKIIALSGYINEILIFLAQEIKTYLDANRRYVEILKESLEKIDETVGDQLYDSLLTGMMSEELKDWLENTIGERGIARWTKIGDTAFDNTRRTVFYHLVPSCERLIILLNNIKGTASASFSGDEDFKPDLISACIDSVQKFMKLLFECTIKVNKEQALFNSFVAWINFVLRELKDEEPNTIYKTSDVSEFINSHLERSSLMMFIPNMRRHYNEIKITSSDLFDSIKGFIKKSIIPSERKIELGMITEKQKLMFDHESLYILSYTNCTLNIHKFNTIADQLKSVHVLMDDDISDIQVSDGDDEVFVVTGDEVISFGFYDLFGSTNQTSFKKSDLKLLKSKNFAPLKPKHIAIKSQRDIWCIIFDDLKKCLICSLKSKPNTSADTDDIDTETMV
ncbi:hypothetical protein WICANDRAFT_75904 [Wickerhamomyces anomalus NRRL Y-366-8]|uniref:Anaphase-promoting complex subunit 4 n=1 Tax=Wickerhamomyces anomalus (strain ATCC 58044 / CBS 1984 / NCYC 433 / NRRL Y-366-8) TaxID=683960 RepID=A0A1E3P8H2_WICAA|nr:uncharacterized protein WICANDRAFT_75904 [Wickerhamomyces anomalus NRRL Y-366-8]ODQ61701.1 hypothetical protein WICANDRAFT_75904 [Wickerhamomyces anomalus NRRL Y-366-8]